MKLTRKQLTAAVTRYARKHGYYVRTVRTVTVLRYAAIKEYADAVRYTHREEQSRGRSGAGLPVPGTHAARD